MYEYTKGHSPTHSLFDTKLEEYNIHLDLQNINTIVTFDILII